MPAFVEDLPDEIDLLRILRILWARKWIVLITAFFGLCLGVFFYASARPIYRADALLQLEERTRQLSLPTELAGLASADPRTVTEIELLQSRMILGQVVADLNLDWLVIPSRIPVIGDAIAQYPFPMPETDRFITYQRYGETLDLSFLEVPPDWVGKGIRLVSGGANRPFTLIFPDGHKVTGSPGEMLRDDARAVAVEIASIQAPAGRIYTLIQIPEQRAIAAVRPNLKVAEKGRRSGILQMTYTAGTGMQAIRVLDSIGRVYVRQNIERSAAEIDNSLKFIEEQLPRTRARQQAAEEALDAYRLDQGTVDVNFETSSVMAQVTKIETDLSLLDVQEAQIAERYTRNHPVYQQLLNQRDRLTSQLADLRLQIDDLPETQREIFNLSRDVEIAQETFAQLQVRFQEVQVLRASTVGNVRIVDTAQVQPGRVSPNRKRILGINLLLGIILGIALVLLRAWLRPGIRSTEEIEVIDLPVFATINFSKQAKESTKNRKILAITDPTDLTVEAFRSLRTSLHFGMLDAASSSVAISSAAPASGKSFTAMNLAVVSALAGQKVCLVDCDMRRGHLRKSFDYSKKSPGLSDYLSDGSSLADVLIKSEVEGLDVICAGAYPPNPSELLMRPKFAKLLKELDQTYDLILLDCPPALAVTDPIIVGREAGAVLIVVNYGKTTKEELIAVKKVFGAGNIPITGTILNGFNPKDASATGYSYSYQYSYETDKS
jgi:tyrosine-protein kinase Etk/Wzc